MSCLNCTTDVEIRKLFDSFDKTDNIKMQRLVVMVTNAIWIGKNEMHGEVQKWRIEEGRKMSKGCDAGSFSCHTSYSCDLIIHYWYHRSTVPSTASHPGDVLPVYYSRLPVEAEQKNHVTTVLQCISRTPILTGVLEYEWFFAVALSKHIRTSN